MRNRPTYTSRHFVQYGESLDFDVIVDATSYLLWAREAPTPGARWIAQGGYNIAGDVVIAAPASAVVVPLFEAAGFTIDWPEIDLIAQEGEREALQVISYVDGRASMIDRYQVPVIDASSPNVVIAQEREILALLLEQRKEAADTGGMTELTLPDGRAEKYADVMVLDRRIAEVRARIAWFGSAARGVSVPGLRLW